MIVNDRPTDGGQGTNIVAQAGAIPTWLRLTRSGNSVTASTSSDGVTFTPVSTQTLTLQSTVFVGMAVASHDVTTLATSSFNNVSLVGSAAPTAALTSAPNITAAQVTPYQFTVTYNDTANINASTIGAGNITVTGPGGYTQAATLVSQNLANGTSVAAVYSVPAPTVNGAYAISANANSVMDVNANPLPAGSIGTFNVAVSSDSVAPTAVLTTHPAVASTTQPYLFSITYADNIAVKASTIGDANVVVTGPGGFSQHATLVSTGLTNAASVVAQYSIPAPATSGTYTVSVLANQVTDTSGNPVAAGSLGTFSNPGSGTTGGGGTGSISGTAISSLNLSPIAGQIITLNNGATTTTDASGNFSFANLTAGTYTVSETLPTGVILTDPATNGRQIAVAGGQAVTGVQFATLPAPAASGPDLTATLIAKIPGSVIAGTKGAPLKVKITNIGAGLASGPVNVTLFASPDGTLSASDVAITTVSSGALKLKTGASKTISVNYNYPTGLASGSYRIVAVVNSSNSLAETNYTDNTSASTPVTIAPAFVKLTATISAFSRALVHGKTGSATISVTNTGNSANSAPISVSLYESPVASFQTGDILLGTATSKTKIKANSHGTIRVSFKTPVGITAGNEFLVAVVNGDTANAVASSSQVSFS